ncbi:MAG TPA: UDP-N-acetylmuramate dehydrogenase [Candidatus Paceibacterota bacterium]|nr:UDP-N-acetylmuramate dehydrogenase [Candidatus Paceibacterota bacterium]
MINVQKNVSIKPHLNFEIGGSVSHFAEVATPEEIIYAIKHAKSLKLPHIILGGGNNVVFCDKKKKCFLIKIAGGDVTIQGEHAYAGAGVDLFEFILKMIKAGLGGLETLSGIPGTIGGAIYGNAGAYGHSISECVESVTIFDGKKIRKVSNKDCKFEYRESIFKKKKWIILGADFKFQKADPLALQKISDDITKVRWEKFGKKPRCPGSYFKNVLVKDISKKSLKLIDPAKIRDGKIPAGYLLEEVGAKGMHEGGVYVSEFHGNIIMNDGTGSYKDLMKLVHKLRMLVKKKFGIELEEEVRYFV